MLHKIKGNQLKNSFQLKKFETSHQNSDGMSDDMLEKKTLPLLLHIFLCWTCSCVNNTNWFCVQCKWVEHKLMNSVRKIKLASVLKSHQEQRVAMLPIYLLLAKRFIREKVLYCKRFLIEMPWWEFSGETHMELLLAFNGNEWTFRIHPVAIGWGLN